MMRLAALGAGMLAAACSDPGSPPRARAEAAVPRWAVDSTAVRAGAGPGQELDRVYGGLLRADGSFVVGNSGTAELRFFDPSGRPTRSAGRRGAGPGEFGGINWLAALPGDSLLAFDLRHQRFSVWSADGVFARAFTSQTPPGPVRPLGVFDDGSILVALEGRFDPRSGPGVVRDSMRMVRIWRDGEILLPMGSHPGAEWLVYERPGSVGATQLPFGKTAHVAVLRDRFVYGSSQSARLQVFDRAGRPIRTIDLEAPPVRVSPQEIQAMLGETQDQAERAALARHYGSSPDVTAPVFTALHADRDGNLWARLAGQAPADSASWLVVGPEGNRLGSVRMHASWHPLDIHPNTLLLRETDADGVQTVSVRKVGK